MQNWYGWNSHDEPPAAYSHRECRVGPSKRASYLVNASWQELCSIACVACAFAGERLGGTSPRQGGGKQNKFERKRHARVLSEYYALAQNISKSWRNIIRGAKTQTCGLTAITPTRWQRSLGTRHKKACSRQDRSKRLHLVSLVNLKGTFRCNGRRQA